MIKLNLFYMWYQMFQCQYWAIFFAIPKKWPIKDVIKFERTQIKKTILGSKMLAQRSLWNLRGNVIPVQTAGLTFLNHSICLIMENLFQWWQDESGMRLLVKARRMRRSSHLSSVCQWLEARIIYIYIYILYIYIHIITLQCCYTHTHTLFSILQCLDYIYNTFIWLIELNCDLAAESLEPGWFWTEQLEVLSSNRKVYPATASNQDWWRHCWKGTSFKFDKAKLITLNCGIFSNSWTAC